MKKVLFVTLAMAVATTGFAQKHLLKKSELTNQSVKMEAPVLKGNEAPVLNFEQPEVITKAATHNSSRYLDEYQIMTSYYDLQTNSALGSRVATWADGTAAFVATWDNTGTSSYGNRGTGYNYFDGSSFGDEPEMRIESAYSGWPSIAPCGDGEILASHANSKIHVYKRETKGEGEWQNTFVTSTNTTWPRIGTTGNGQYVHIVSSLQNSSNTLENYVYYYRSTDGGQTFSDLAYPPLVDVEGMYRYTIGADDYVMATRDNTVAILFGGLNYDMFYIISHDNGETWEKQVIWNYPYDHSVNWTNPGYTIDTDTIWAPDGSQSITIDANGTVHVVFPLIRWVPSTDNDGSYTYFPYTDGIVYWNSNYTNEQGTHEIPNFGDWSGDIEHPEWSTNGTNGISSTLNADRVWALAGADDYANLYLISAPDEDGNGTVDFTDYWNNTSYHYRSHCISTMPGISVDEQGNLLIIYSTLSELRVDQLAGHHYRSAYVTTRDHTGTWFENGINLSDGFSHLFDEAFSTTCSPYGMDGSFWVCYFTDEYIGLYMDYTSGENNNNNGMLTENYMYAVKVTPDMEGWGVEEPKAVNPMTTARIYPNPVSDRLFVEVNASRASEMSITIYNITGQKVMEENVNITTGINTPSVNTSSLTSGIYFVTVKANGFDHTMKFIVK